MQDKVNMTEEQRDRQTRFEYDESVRNIRAWKAHLLRSSNQDEAKQHVLQKLDENLCLIIMDWAMQFLPVLYRGQMSDSFWQEGKKLAYPRSNHQSSSGEQA